MDKLQRALSVADIKAYKPNLLNFTGEWLECIGCPELTGAWIIWGSSGSGKTSFALQLAKYLARFENVIYNSMEQGMSYSIQLAIGKINMDEVSRSFHLLKKEPIDKLIVRLKKPKSPKIVFIDSLQYARFKSYNEYIDFKEALPDKLLIFVSHADGIDPKGDVAKSARYDADVKIRVSGYLASPSSRFGGGKPYIVWREGYDKINIFK